MPNQKAIAQLDLNLLKVFECLYQEQNMTRAATVLNITPSAVSHAVTRLRTCLDDPLFQRSNQKMLPTPACQRMAPLIIDTLSRMRQLLQQWGEFDPSTSHHHFTLGLHEAFEPSILPVLARKIGEVAPFITFSSVRVDRNNLLRDLSAGHLDLAVDVALSIKAPVLHEKVNDEAFCVLLNKGHQYAESLTQTHYFNSQHISVSHRAKGAAVEDFMFQQKGLARHIALRCQNYLAASYLVGQSECLLTLPNTLGQNLLNEHLILLPCPVSLPPLATHIYWHQHNQDDAALSWFKQLISELFI